MLLVSLPLCFLVLWGVRDTNYDIEPVTKIEDVSDAAIEGLALPPGHVVGEHLHKTGSNISKKSPDVTSPEVE